MLLCINTSMYTYRGIITTYQATTNINPSHFGKATGPPPSPCDKWNALRCSPHWLQRGVPHGWVVAQISNYHWVPQRILEFQFKLIESEPAGKICKMYLFPFFLDHVFNIIYHLVPKTHQLFSPWSSASRKNSWEKRPVPSVGWLVVLTTEWRRMAAAISHQTWRTHWCRLKKWCMMRSHGML